MKRIIVNADDFGINEVVTAEIERMVELGVVSSTTVMANGSCLDEARRFATLHPEVSFGIHLCLSEFDSVTKSESLYRVGLTDEDGRFIHKAVFGLNNFNNTELKKAIRDELNSQIDIVSSLGFTISHADSHHHVHSIYPLREVFSEVLRSRGIKKIRLGRDFLTFRMKAHLRQWIQRVKLNIFYSSQFTTTNAFYSYSEFMKCNQNRNDEKIVELMCHPGHLEQSFRNEMLMVEAREALEGENIKMISYNEL